MPRTFLESVLRADADGCVLIAVPKEVHAADLAIAPGDRLIVDTSVTDIFSVRYAVVHDGVLIVADARAEEGRRLAGEAAMRRRDMVLIGQIVGVLAALR